MISWVEKMKKLSEEFRERLESLDMKLDKANAKLTDISIIQSSQAKDLENHIKRTDLLEDMVKPVHSLYQQIKGVIKFLAILTSLGGLYWVFDLLSKIF